MAGSLPAKLVVSGSNPFDVSFSNNGTTMKRKSNTHLSVLCSIAAFVFTLPIINHVTAQQTPQPKVEPKKVVEILQQAEEVIRPNNRPQPPVANPASSKVVVIINSDNIRQMLIVGEDGKWISDAREIQLDLNIDKGTPTVKCTLYNGLFKPTQPVIKSWDVGHIMTADKEEFQGVIDGLNKGQFNLGN